MGLTWDIQVKVAKGVFILNLIIGIFSFFIFNPWMDFIKGLLFGTIIGLLNFRLLALTIEKSVQMPPNKAQIYAGSRYVIRFFINAVVLFISIKADYINVIGTIIGLLSIKPMVLKIGLFNDINFFKKIFIKSNNKRREEN